MKNTAYRKAQMQHRHRQGNLPPQWWILDHHKLHIHSKIFTPTYLEFLQGSQICFAGSGGSGKTNLALHIALCLAIEKPLKGGETIVVVSDDITHELLEMYVTDLTEHYGQEKIDAAQISVAIHDSQRYFNEVELKCGQGLARTTFMQSEFLENLHQDNSYKTVRTIILDDPRFMVPHKLDGLLSSLVLRYESNVFMTVHINKSSKLEEDFNLWSEGVNHWLGLSGIVYTKRILEYGKTYCTVSNIRPGNRSAFLLNFRNKTTWEHWKDVLESFRRARRIPVTDTRRFIAPSKFQYK